MGVFRGRPLACNLIWMVEGQLLGRHIAEFAGLLGSPVVIPFRPPEGDAWHGLSRYVELPERGIAIVIDWNDIAECIQFFSDKKEARYRQYQGELLCGLSFHSSRDAVRAVLGEPAQFNNGGKIMPVLGRILPWDWFEHDGGKVHFQYSETCDEIVMVSLAPLPKTDGALS